MGESKYIEHNITPVKPNKTIEIYKIIKNNNAYKILLVLLEWI
jgi:hypothetical protein